ncbi:sugar ABC transporter substrate-binding protein [Paenibacillus stellifer]|uniref:Sugar ABC transporter substrate-binding protein n=1 Tax=Paenibacillus stellifer TaxID=169760 RepID=A0A089LPR2_9BACL|nr:extracellular solute-binding protein [Paenibacillus stellifer]AIQ62847.1 sugar ABC transporter substrate-binding protein [Paenibacillus stellifer]
MKRIFKHTATLMLLASVALAGCSSNSGGNAAATEGAAASPATASGEKVKLTMGSWRTDDKEVYDKIIAAFNKQYPNIEIDFSPTKSTEYNTVLNTALQTGGGPDIIHLRPYAAGIALGDSGYVEPINGLKGLDAFSKDVLAAATGKDGNIYGVPMGLNTVAIMYNKDIFAKYNLQIPSTWNELVDTAKKLKENKVTPFAMGTKDGWILSITHSALGPSAYGGSAFAEQLVSGEKKFTDPAYVKSLQLMKDLSPYFADNFTGVSYEDMRTLFVTGQAAMYIMGDFDAGVIESQNPDLHFDVFPVPPQSAGGSPTVTTYVDGSFGVNANSKHKEEAKKFLEFAASQEFGNLFSNEMKRVSPVPGVSVSDPVVAKFAEYANTISTPYVLLANFGVGNPTTKVTMENDMQALFFDKMTAEKVAEDMQASSDKWKASSK